MPTHYPSMPLRCTIAAAIFLLSTARPLTAGESPAPPPDDAPSVATPAPSAGVGPAATPSRSKSPPLATPNVIPNIGGGIWLAEGPGPAIFGQVEGISPGPNEVVGAVHTVAAHPTDADIVYLGGANGGIWKTTNALATGPIWTPLTDAKPSLSIGALEFDPTDGTHDTLVAGIGRYSSLGQLGGARTGKLLKTTDGGATWAELAGFIGSISAAGISGVAPRGSTIAASVNVSDAFFCADLGIWRSTDGGATFTSVNPLSVPPGPLGIAFDLAGDPAVPGTLYTGMTFVASLCSSGSPFTNGIYKSIDTGLTWVKVSDPAMDALIVDGTTNNIEIAVDGLHVYANIIQSGRPAGIFHSPDGGATWTAMDLPRTPEGAPLPIGTVGSSPFCAGPPVFIDTSPTPHGFFGLAEEVELMGILDGGGLPHPINGVWTTVVTGPFTFDLVGSCDTTPWMGGTGTWQKVVGLSPKEKPGSQGGIHAAIRVDPSTPTTVYLGGDRQDSPFPNLLGALDFSGRLFRGDTTVAATGAIPSPQWEHLTHSDSVAAIPGGGTGNSSAPHADSREMVFDASGNLIEVDDGGIYHRTMPLGNVGGWGSMIGNLQVTEQHDVAYDSVSNVIISGNQDTGTTQQQMPGGNLTWDSVTTADGGDVAVDDVTVPAVSTRFSSFQNLGAFRRREYDPSNGLVSEMFPTLTPLGALSVAPQFITPVELNAITPTSLLIGGCNAIFESFDQGDSVSEIPGSVGIGCPSALTYGGMFGGGADPGTSWAGVGSALYERIAFGGYVSRASYPGSTITDIAVDPSSTGTAYVTDGTDIWRTYDDGATWEMMTGNLTDSRLGAIAIDGAAGRLFVGGREGVSTIALPPASVPSAGPYVWGQIGTGLPNAPVWDMEWDAAVGKLVVGTLGRGAWSLQENGLCAGGTIPDKLTVRNQWVAAAQLDEACTQITAGAALDVMATGDLTLKSPLVVFLNGVAVKSSGKLTVENAVP